MMIGRKVMVVNDAGLALIKSFEGCERSRADGKFQSYRCPANVPTIGYGSTGPDIGDGLVWTQAQCDARFLRDVSVFAQKVDAMIRDAETSPNQFAALVSLAYNIGACNFAKSSVLRFHKAGDHPEAQQAFGAWNKGGGKVLPGLVRRRAAEAALYGSAA